MLRFIAKTRTQSKSKSPKFREFCEESSFYNSILVVFNIELFVIRIQRKTGGRLSCLPEELKKSLLL